MFTAASRSIVARASRGALSLQQSVTPACAPFQHIMSFHVNQLDTERVQSDTGKALSDSELLRAPAQSRDPQVQDADQTPVSDDPVHGHSGTSVPENSDVIAAKKGEPQFVGSGEPLDISTVTNEDPATAFGTGGL